MDDTVDTNKEVKEYKTKDYVRRAVNKYRKKKYAEDAEYKAKHIASVMECREKNKEKYNEYNRKYMKEYYARKKREKEEQAKQNQTNETNKPDTNTNLDTIADSLENLKIKKTVKAT